MPSTGCGGDMVFEKENSHSKASAQQGDQPFGNPYTGTKPHSFGTPSFDNINAAGVDSFFDFEPHSGTGTPGRQGHSANFDFDFGNALQSFQPLSPPDSGVFPSDNWQNFEQDDMPHNILTQIDPSRARAQYGQTTPPDDDVSSTLELQLGQQQYSLPSPDSSSPGRTNKRKQPSGDSTQSSAPPKRVRKSTARSTNGQVVDPDDHRSKFLERNRVAASKCRQKKKEWTQDLENKARDLQRQNNNLRLMMDSCKEEIIFLKEEMLKHTSCGCNTIQDYLKQGAKSYEDSDIVKQEPNSGIPSPDMSMATDHDRNEMGTALDGDEAWQPTVEENLEALLRPQYGHDTSHEGIAERVGQ